MTITITWKTLIDVAILFLPLSGWDSRRLSFPSLSRALRKLGEKGDVAILRIILPPKAGI